MTAARCPECEAPLAVEQRWCVVCGARQAGADPRTLLFGASRPSAAAPPPGDGSPPPQAGSRPPLLSAGRRRRAALPVALASLVGLVVVSGTSVPASLAGSSLPPFTVVLPAQVAQAPAAAEPAATEPAAVEPAAAAPLAATPVAATPAAATPAATDDTPAADTPATETPAADDPAAEAPAETSPIKHVFLIALGGADLNALAGDAAAAPYLAGTLVKSGTLLSDYRTVARGGLADRIALISGQGPTPQTLDDCTTYGDVTPADALADGQTGGDGCVYGAETGHLGDQLTALERTWKAYVEPAAGAARAASGATPLAHAAAACRTDAQTTRRNPFLWFHGTVDADDCDAHDVPLTQLKKDLRAAETTPALSWIASDAQQGSADADRFLERVVPQIQNSLAYADGGLIVIVGGGQPAAQPEAPAPPAATTPTTPTEPPVAPPTTTTTPSDPAPTATTPTTTTTTPAPTPAAGRALAPTSYANVGDAAAAGAGIPVGALLISSHTPSGSVDRTPANAFTLLRTLQEIYGVDPLGYAAAKGVAPLSDTLFSVTP